jgi:hypothetical protein
MGEKKMGTKCYQPIAIRYMLNTKRVASEILIAPANLTKPACLFYITAGNIYKTIEAVYHNVGNEFLKLF